MMARFGIGQAVRRKEDVRLLTGQGCYTDDINLEGQGYVYFLRSPHAHARIASIDTSAAVSAPGVIAILTGKDAMADGLPPIPCQAKVSTLDGKPMHAPPRHALAVDVVRHVGELVAMIVADTREMAADASELIDIDYIELPSIVSTANAMAPDAPRVWPENPYPANVCVSWENTDPRPVARIFDQAPHVIEVDLVNNRLMGNPMEPRCALAEYNPETGVRTLYCPSQGVHRMHRTMADLVFRIPHDKLRIISRDVGGGFGVRSKAYPENILLVWAAKKLGRPLKWLGTRFDTMVSDNHARDHVTHARIALDDEARILALWIDTTANMGAYLSEMGPRIPTLIGQRSTGSVYVVPALYNIVNCVFTHTTPTDSYRGAGRPEVAYVMERLMDAAASALGIDAAEIRKRNFISPQAMPYTNTQGLAIDSGEFLKNQEAAMKLADWDGFPRRRNEARTHGKMRGIGIGNFIECSGGLSHEQARVRFEPDGRVSVFVGTFSHGQGHETAFSQILVEKLGVDFDKINFVDAGDNFTVAEGYGTYASRSAHMGGSAIARACDQIVSRGRTIAARLLQADPADVEFGSGVFTVADTTGTVTLQEVARAAADTEKCLDGTSPGLDETCHYARPDEVFNWPNGCHIAEVEIDPDTGEIAIVGYCGVDDCGVVLNPMIVHGQTYGAIAQGLGQAMLENTVYDEDSGQLLSASFMDYGMPRASDMPVMTMENNEVRCTTNDLGVKGVGEGGTCGAPPAIVNAVLNALAPLGVTRIDMPLTSEKIWRAIREAGS